MIGRTVLFSLLIISFLVSACGFNAPGGFAGQTPTPTPFLPNFGGEVPAEQPVVVVEGEPEAANVGNFAPPSAASDIAVPEPMGTLAQPEGQINILLMGSDQRPNDGGFRTDVNLLLTL
ncbi:MAG: hypothetical protein WEC37_01880, partial [Anaerolineales bacterium]